MFRKFAGVLLAVLCVTVGAYAQMPDWAWYEVAPAGGYARYGGTNREVAVLQQIGPTEYQWKQNPTVNPAHLNFWWGYNETPSDLSEWDRYPLPWGDTTWEFRNVIHSTGFGRDALLMDTGFTPPSFIEYHFTVPRPAVIETVWSTGGRWFQLFARATSSDAWTSLAHVHTATFTRTNPVIPTALMDVSVPGQTSFQVRYQPTTGAGVIAWWATVTATTYPAGTVILIE